MALPLPQRKQSRNFAFTQSQIKSHRHNRIREFILYLCPTGSFANVLENFWAKTRELNFSNGAHTIPHITLLPFFKAHEDAHVNFTDIINSLAEDGKYLNKTMELEKYTSSNFIGFFVKEDDGNVLKRMALKFVKEISDIIISDTIDGLDHLIACFPYCASAVNDKTSSSRCIPKNSRSISLEPNIKNLHLTLAYQFPTSIYQNLLDLVEQIDITCANSWELRLYSRDPRLATKHVHKIIYSHSSRENDELDLRVGDYVYINADAVQNSVDGWVEAVHHSSGLVGFVPINHTERSSETNVWTLHASVPLCQVYDKEISVDAIDGVIQNVRENDFYIDENRLCFSQSTKMEEINLGRRGRRRIIIVRHGERVDFAFGNAWTTFSFNDDKYVRHDLNMPVHLPPRHPEEWEKDSPLTTIGIFQSHQVGQSLKDFGVNFSKVFVSPSYRCVQTADEILKAMESQNIPLCVEFGLFEWLLWYEDGLPQFLTTQELAVIFNINEDYMPFMKREDLEENLKESLEDFYNRSLSTMRKILGDVDDGDILIVAHAINLETSTRELIGKKARSRADLRNLLMRIPYLACVALMDDESRSQFQLIDPPCLTMTHNSCMKFDWRILDDN